MNDWIVNNIDVYIYKRYVVTDTLQYTYIYINIYTHKQHHVTDATR